MSAVLCETVEHAVIPSSDDTIVIRVGQDIFHTTSAVLLCHPETYFHGMLSGNFKKQEDGSYFIARDGESFKYILEFMTYGRLCSAIHDRGLLRKLLVDADFYGLSTLYKQVEQMQRLRGQDSVADFLDGQMHAREATPMVKAKFVYAYYRESQDVPIKNTLKSVENFRLILEHIAQQFPDPPSSHHLRHILTEFRGDELCDSHDVAQYEKLRQRLQHRIVQATPNLFMLDREQSCIEATRKRASMALSESEERLQAQRAAGGNTSHLVQETKELRQRMDEIALQTADANLRMEAALREHEFAFTLLGRVFAEFDSACSILMEQLEASL